METRAKSGKKPKKNNWITYVLIAVIVGVIGYILYFQNEKKKLARATEIWLAEVERHARENTQALAAGNILPHPLPSEDTILAWLDEAGKLTPGAQATIYETTQGRGGSTRTTPQRQVLISAEGWPYQATKEEKLAAFRGTNSQRFQNVFVQNWLAYWTWQTQINLPDLISNDGNFKKILSEV